MSAYQNLYNMIQTLPASDGTINTDVARIVQNHQTQNITVVMAFPLKVGGTFLRTALIYLLAKNYRTQLARGSYASTDQARDLYFPSLLHTHVNGEARPVASIAHCHMYATKPVTSLLEAFNIPVIVNHRNILDTLLSYYEMLEKDAGVGEVARDDFVLQAHTGYHELSEADRRWHLVNVAPIWFSRFYAYWLRYTDDCEKRGVKKPLWTSFNELAKDPEAMIAKIAKHADPRYQYNDLEVKTAYDRSMEKKETLRFNKGIPGRGSAFFSDEEKAAIYRLMGEGTQTGDRLKSLGIF